MVKIGAVVCPRCREDRESLISEIKDPMGQRYVCMVCSCEFRVPKAGALVPMALVCLVLSAGCASFTERIVHDARRGLVWSADYTPKEGGQPEALAALLHHLTVDLGIQIQFLPADDPDMDGAFGRSMRTDDAALIIVRQDLSVNGTIEVLAHEAAHLFQPPHLTRSQGDVFAEIVGAHVAHKLGVPRAAETSALWLRQHKPSLPVAMELRREIEYVAKMLSPEF